MLYGHVVDRGDEVIDEVLLLLMRAARTRETVVEFHGHGGLRPAAAAAAGARAGARRALPGIQKRAFNGRLDLTRAEAISELVSARSHRAAQLAIQGLDGGLQERIGTLRHGLLDQLAELEARVDFEENLPPLDGTCCRCCSACGRTCNSWCAMASAPGCCVMAPGWRSWGAPTWARAACSMPSAAANGPS